MDTIERENLAKLPKLCYSILNTTGETIVIKSGQMGYFLTDYGVQGEDAVNSINERLGVSKAQREAMDLGSMFGWDAPGANPDLYDPKVK